MWRSAPDREPSRFAAGRQRDATLRSQIRLTSAATDRWGTWRRCHLRRWRLSMSMPAC